MYKQLKYVQLILPMTIVGLYYINAIESSLVTI